MERLRTQFLFKQQELEASVRKPPMSVRTKRVGRELPSTPVAVPPAMRNWQQASQSTSQRALEETPLRPSRPPVPKTSPMKDTRESPARTKKNPPLGFQNAFDTSTPMRSPSNRNKGKARANPPIFGEEPKIPPPAFSQQIPAPPSQILFRESQSSSLPSSSNDFGPNDMATFDQEMGTITQETEADTMLIDEFDSINWKSELCRIFLTHIHPMGEEISFQQLLSYSPSIPERGTYSTSCSKILAVLAVSSRADDYLDSIRTVCGSLLTMVDLLYRSLQPESLAILLDLMSRLVACLPSFSSYLLSTESAKPEHNNMCLGDLLQIITLEQMTSDKPESLNTELANEAITLLETICAYVPSESVPHLQRFLNNRDIVLVLLHTKHPEWFLERSTRLLVLLATHHELWESLLGLSQPDDLKRVVVDRVCSHIVDLNKSATTTFKINILTFIAQIAISNPSAYTALIDSPTLIPSLLLFTSHLATPLWEDDDQLKCSGERLTSVIRVLNQILFLLYHLIFSKNPAVSLADKIQHAPSRAFNCLIHIFTVTFGRLGYCDPPGWMDPNSRHELESMAEIARDILELVFDGPEGDTIWSTFQFDQDEEVEPDEEEF
ncbi:hypothetical protein CPB83DRAFT_264789 [Crepidotus variabilis]|uniref:Uncharacterized protein n=1 Tax=Crepidotus variabilis TaxID=179855 RepID=A0A9P6JQN8_9AGAR|nr:hypothetical protein CPB83DRAFT_264789 [Crepidotus variabilis]